MADSSSVVELLANLFPVKELDNGNRKALADKGRLLDFPQNQHLLAAKEHGWLLYLLEGRVQLSADDKEFTIIARTPRASHPLFTAGRLRDELVFTTPAQVLRLDRKLYDILRKSQSRSSYEVEDVELSEAEGEIFNEIYRACLEGKLSLPALPEVALKIQSAIKDPHIDIKKLARIIEMDLAVTGGLLRAANSAAYGGNRAVKNVRDAVVRLGMIVSRRLVMTIAMQQIFRSKSAKYRGRMQQLWERSVKVAALCSVLASFHPLLDPERAQLAGLLHTVGAVPILDYLANHYPDLSDSEIDEIISKLKGLVGEIVIGYWGLGAEINQLVRYAGDWWHDHPGTAPDYLDLILVAELYFLNLHYPDLPVPHYHEIPAFTRMGLDVPDADLRLPTVEKGLLESVEMAALFGDVPTGH